MQVAIGTYCTKKEAVKAYNRMAKLLGKPLNEIPADETEDEEEEEIITRRKQKRKKSHSKKNLRRRRKRGKNKTTGRKEGGEVEEEEMQDSTQGSLETMVMPSLQRDCRYSSSSSTVKAERSSGDSNTTTTAYSKELTEGLMKSLAGELGNAAWQRIWPILEKERLYADIITSCSHNNFKEVGVSLGDRLRIENAFNALRAKGVIPAITRTPGS